MKDIYVKFGNPALKGESQDKDHPDWIEVSSWRHEIIQPRSATASTSGGHTAERTEHGEMVFTKDLDVVSPLLYQHASGGTTLTKSPSTSCVPTAKAIASSTWKSSSST